MQADSSPSEPPGKPLLAQGTGLTAAEYRHEKGKGVVERQSLITDSSLRHAGGTTAYPSSTDCTISRGHPLCSKHSEGNAACSLLLIDAMLEDEETLNKVLETYEALCSGRSPKRPQALKNIVSLQNHDGSDGDASACHAWVPSLVCEDPLEEEMATHSSALAQRIPCTEESGWL